MDLDEIKRLKEICEKSIHRTLENWDSYLANWDNQEKGERTLKYSLVSNYYPLAINTLLLGDKHKALDLLHKSFDLLSEVFEFRKNEYPTFLDLIHVAILSLDKKQMRAASDLCKKMVDETPKVTVYYIRLLCDLIDGNEDRVREDISVLNEELKVEGEYFPLYLDDLASALLDGDRKKFIEVLPKVLESHDRIRDNYYGNKNSYNYVICIPATVLLILARDRGITIKKEDLDEKLRDYIPWILLEDD